MTPKEKEKEEENLSEVALLDKILEPYPSASSNKVILQLKDSLIDNSQEESVQKELPVSEDYLL